MGSLGPCAQRPRLRITMLTPAQCESLYADGFVVVPGAVPEPVWHAARRQLFMRLGQLQQAALGYSPARPAGMLGGGLEEAKKQSQAVGQLPETSALFEAFRPTLEAALGVSLVRRVPHCAAPPPPLTAAGRPLPPPHAPFTFHLSIFKKPAVQRYHAPSHQSSMVGLTLCSRTDRRGPGRWPSTSRRRRR